MVHETYLPNCLAIGIGAKDFWKMNIRKLRPYLKAEEIKFEKKNTELHLLGLYVHEAVSVAVGNMFRRSTDEVLKYPEKPFEFMSKEKLEEEKRNRALEKLKAQFSAFAESTRIRLEKENGIRS